jgi:hypothetical protein
VTVAVPFLGCRIEELAEINLHKDFHQDPASGVWYFQIEEKPDADGILRKSVKNKASWRCIPIHSALVQLGFVDYLNRQKERGFSRPFESGWGALSFKRNEIESAEDAEKKQEAVKWSHYISGWGGRELRKLIESGKLPTPDSKVTYFHS